MFQETDWNQRYCNHSEEYMNLPREWLVEHHSLLPPTGCILEAAMGLGGNISYLLDAGYDVFAIERSSEAVKYVKRSYPAARVVMADLSRFWLPRAYFDLICNFYYLEWSLMDQFRQSVKPGGLVIFETLTVGMLEVKPYMNRERLLKPGELKAFFRDWDILDYREGWVSSFGGNRKAVASIVARNL